MDLFVAWNLRLLTSYFSPASKGEEVWLAIDSEELDTIGPDLGGDSGFLDAVRSGPPWATVGHDRVFVGRGTAQDLVNRCLGLREQRRNPLRRPSTYVDPGALSGEYEGRRAPSYLPMLAALVRACAAQDERGYYVELRASLGLDAGWGPQQMKELEALWKDLEDWTIQHNGAFGLFKFRKLGGHTRIGTPRSQSIVSRRDVEMLTRVFAQSGARPGQQVSSRLVDDVQSMATSAHFLSKPFRDALANTDFSEPVRERLRSLLSDWDGMVAEGAQGTTATDTDTRKVGEVEIALALGERNTLPWEVRLRVQGIADSGILILRYESHEWIAELTGEDVLTTEAAPVDARELLEQSATGEVWLTGCVRDELRTSTTTPFDLVLQRKPLRTFDVDRRDDKIVLVERPLPSHGVAYLLAAPLNVQNIRWFLARNEIAFEECPLNGLPDKWLLLCVTDCATIGDEARNEMPDGLATRSRPRVVRFIGGRSVQRAGLRQYLSYDLPAIELDGPAGARIAGDGLELHEHATMPAIPSLGVLGRVSSLRRFDIFPLDSRMRSFDIHAQLGGERLGSARLRVVAADGLATATHGSFSLDPQGNPQRDSIGLLGARLAGKHEPSGQDRQLLVDLGRRLVEGDAVSFTENAAAEFLDALAQAGSLAYGVARDQLRRLVSRQKFRGERDVLEILRQLRGRGHLEIESDSKGRWIRVHGAPPTIYTLPVKARDGEVIAGVAGTLRLGHWKELLGSGAHAVSAYSDLHQNPVLPALCLACKTVTELGSFARVRAFEMSVQPARGISQWAAFLGEVRAALEPTAVESLGSHVSSAERYKPTSGQFGDTADGLGLHRGIQHQLFRLDDKETGRHKLYSLGFRDSESKPRYAFVRDSRWGLWIALSAFAEVVRSHGVEDASPWPFEYSREDFTLWLPARLSLPVVLERALILCSGNRAARRKVSRGTRPSGVLLEDHGGFGTLGVVSSVYDGFVPTYPAWATWLGYRWVPEDIAQLVAARLGGRLQYMSH